MIFMLILWKITTYESYSNCQRLWAEYIRFAEEKVKAIYTIVEEEIKEKQEVWNNAFVKECNEGPKKLNQEKWAKVKTGRK